MGNNPSKPKKKEKKKKKKKEKPMIRGLVRRKGEKNPYKWGFEVREEGLAVPYWRDAPGLPPKKESKEDKEEALKKEFFQKGWNAGQRAAGVQPGTPRGGSGAGYSRGSGAGRSGGRSDSGRLPDPNPSSSG